MPARNLFILIVTAIISIICYHTASRNHYGGLLSLALGEIDDSFVRPVDDRKLFEGAMDGMIRELDPYSDYISPEELQEFQEDLDQKFGGIGIMIEFDDTAKRITVLSPMPDTPAIAAGIRAGDQILAIDGQSIDGTQIREAVKLMRGDPGTVLTLSVLHRGEEEPEDITLRRAIIPVASVWGDKRNADGTWDFTMRGHPNIGFIRLSTFGENTATELRGTLASIDSLVDGLILDLRRNGGGLLRSATDVCDLFIDSGTIVSIRGRERSDWRDYYASAKETVFQKPMVVIIDGYSASASEITAGCLQDHDRAIIVGERSWGKGTVQNVLPFEGGQSALKLTIATYWRPSGKNIHRHVDATEDDAWGVIPNEGYEVTTTDDILGKIIKLRQKRDKVLEDDVDSAAKSELKESEVAESTADETGEPESNPDTDEEAVREGLPSEEGSDVGEPNNSDEEQTTDNSNDLEGFEDPQRQRALEAVLELIEQRKTGDDGAPKPMSEK